MPAPKRPFTDQEKDTLSTLTQHMGNPLDEFDMEVAHHLERMGHERNYQRMRAAQTGGDQELGPGQFEQEQSKQAQSIEQQATAAGEQKAAQAQSAKAPVSAPPAPAGPAGVSAPYPAQAKPGAMPTGGMPKGQPQQQQQPPAAPGPEPQLPTEED
jgi:hypothetical protein